MSRSVATDAVWVRTDPAADGTYVVTIEAGPDHARVLDRPSALAYAEAVLTAVAQAEYDAAVFAQLSALGLDTDAVSVMVQELRADRPPLDHSVTAPLAFSPGVSVARSHPFLTLYLDGEAVGQWEVNDARGHALAVLETVAVADLDNAYRRHLIGNVGLDRARAEAAVEDLGKHRTPWSIEPA